MRRNIEQQLKTWKNSSRRKPLILNGARQVGKTYSLSAFGKSEYENVAYINFEIDSKAAAIFDLDLKPERIIEELQLYLRQTITPGSTLLVFDEIQMCPSALTSLKYFHEQANEYHIAAAGSLLGVQLAQSKSFPVGQVNFLHMYPLTFFEFLNANGKRKLVEFLIDLEVGKAVPEIFHQELINLLKRYYLIGGMPEAVSIYCEKNDLNAVRDVHNEILASYVRDFSKYADAHDVMRINAVWESLPAQLAKENKKFIYSIVAPSARAREYEIAINWLLSAGLVYKAKYIGTPKLPLSAYVNHQIFKLYALDVGLLSSMSGLGFDVVVDGHRLFTEFNGALTENYVAGQLQAAEKRLYYWASGNIAEVDFVTQRDSHLIPIEVKAGKSLKSKSLLSYVKKYDPELSIKLSLNNVESRGKTVNYPLYLLNALTANVLKE